MSARDPFHHDTSELAGCPLWTGALFMIAYGVIRIGAAETFYEDGVVHLLVAFFVVGASILYMPFWRWATPYLLLAVSLIGYELTAPYTPMDNLHWWLLLPAVLLLFVGRWLYGYLGAGQQIRPMYGSRAYRVGFESGRRPRGRSAEEALAATPICFRRLGLTLPCTHDQVKDAFRSLVREAHPDHGGDPEVFLQLKQAHVQAMQYLDAQSGRWRVRR